MNPQEVVDYIGHTSNALERAKTELQEKRAADARIQARIPQVVDAMVANGRIGDEPATKQALAEALRDPERTLDLLAKTAAHRNAAELGQLGVSVDQRGQTKKASARPNPHENRDRALFEGLGLQYRG